eukprot:gene7512-15370_t
MISLASLKVVLTKVTDDNNTSSIRKYLQINPCEPSKISFDGESDIKVNNHCGLKLKIYEVRGAGSADVNGYYEPYGTLSNAVKYEKVLDNGTIFRLQRDSNFNWVIKRSDLVTLYEVDSSKKSPPKKGWESIQGQDPAPTLILHNVDKIKNKVKYVDIKPFKVEESLDAYGNIDIDAKYLKQMLHPAVGPELGKILRKTYKSGYPVESISLDGLLDDELLRKALTFKEIPLNKWVGPENGLGCCLNKYRLNFDKWRTNKWARGLQSLTSDRTFTRFLEELTGIEGIVPVKVSDDRFIQLGSSLIAVKRGGYLDVHNDFNVFNDVLYRRINLLFYLNEEWKDSWQGHIELWTANMSRPVQRIAPIFNRMAIFTVTDDAYHGHPEPLNAPDDIYRYALQLVYYTKEPGPIFSNTAGPKRVYNGSHSAVFQPYCAGTPLKEFCKTCKRDSSYGDRRCCECNYDR